MICAGRHGLTALVFVLALAPPVAIAQDGPAAGALDGRVFSGMIGPEGELDLDEELHFNQGMMWSRRCVPCGFQPAPYWTRRVGTAIEFTGVLVSETGSVFDYLGTARDGDIRVRVRWTKDRWYWSIDRTLIFEGRIDDARSPIAASAAAIAAREALNRDMPDWCP